MLKNFDFQIQFSTSKINFLHLKFKFLDNSETWQNTFLIESSHFHHFWTTLFSKSDENAKCQKPKRFVLLKYHWKRHFQLSETDFWYRKWILQTFKCFAKSLCSLPKEIHTLINFLITRTIDITNRQVKIFYPCTP